ncbi:MAG: hypothetical protein WBV94_03345 [Blastocatellia bacterium]
MADKEHLLVPIKVQALVIDDLVIARSGTLKNRDQQYIGNDGKWSPLAQNYRSLINALGAPGPKLFYGAGHTYNGQQTDQLVFEAEAEALPTKEDHGVYLHWVLPSGLRHSYESSSLEFPALPDQWLIVRFCRRGAEPQTKAWFVDSSLVGDSDDAPNLLIDRGDEYKARRVGKVVPLDDEFAPADPQAERTTITAVGNQHTGSPTFTAFVAENRNILSWHDDLDDLRDPANDNKVPKATALSYLLLGWYHDERNEPLAALPVKLVEQKEPDPPGWLIDPPGWFIDSASLPADLLKRRCLFHGMVAHINYWNSDTYQGTMLGYPGSPSVEGVFRAAPPSITVGVGNNAEDALVSLVSGEYSGSANAPNLWKALEAVIYRQIESLVGGWNTAPRDQTVHQSWFSTLEAGKVWAIRPRSDKATDPAATAARPTPKQLDALKQLNELQSAADAAGRELAALQQDLYARWWKLSEKSRRDETANLDDEEADCRALIGRVSDLRGQRNGVLERLRTMPEKLERQLPKELELRFDAAPRFWTPADPVIVVNNCGLPTKHQFPRPLPCRLPEQIVTVAEVVVEKKAKPFSLAAGVTQQIATAVRTHFAEHYEILTRLLEEASIVEQAITDLAARTLPADKRFDSANSWRKWTGRLFKDLTGDNQAEDQVRFGNQGDLNMPPYRLVELWGQQPWSPLFLDWQITWFPTQLSGQGFGPAWRLGEYDYQPVNKESLPQTGYTVQGRSLLAPIDERIFMGPIETLRGFLNARRGPDEKTDGDKAFTAAVTEILSRYEEVWDKTLRKLAAGGLMGQALTGFHQALIRRDVTLPRVMPDPARPWIKDDVLKSLDGEVSAMLSTPDEAALIGERLPPPAPPPDPFLPPPPLFQMVRAGAFKLDELWLVDDFGQWADLLHGTSAGGAFGAVFHPRARWEDDQFVVAMPPRVVQPVRLNFRFTAADNPMVESGSDSALDPVCGWVFHNRLDQALALCDKDGRLIGELVITETQGRFLVDWESGAGGVALDEIRNPSLKAFARALVETAPKPRTRLQDLLELINSALKRIRPAAARRDMGLFGRPIALVSAALGFELFGKAWTDPQREPPANYPKITGDATLDALRIPVNLGYQHNTEDGLIGYFKGGVYDRIVSSYMPPESEPSGYIVKQATDAVRVGFHAPEPLTLLMDPWGSVQAAAGIVPAKTITLAQVELDKTLARMEASFRVGPVLVQADRLALPTPVGDKGRWSFSGPLTDNTATLLLPSDPRYFSDQPVEAAEGQLLLLNTEE